MLTKGSLVTITKNERKKYCKDCIGVVLGVADVYSNKYNVLIKLDVQWIYWLKDDGLVFTSLYGGWWDNIYLQEI